MEKFTDYSCSIGTIEQIKKGLLDKVDINLDYLKSFFKKADGKKIIVPKLVGIYQKESVIYRPEEFEKVADEGIRTFLTSSNLSILRSFLGIRNNLDNYLINVSYASNLIPDSKLVRNMLKDDLGRVSVSSLDNFPDLSMKNTAAIPMVKEFLAKEYLIAQQTRDIGGFHAKENEKMNYLCEKLRMQQKEYGLTIDEYTFLEVIGRMNEPEKGKSKIYKPCASFLNEFESFIQKHNNH